MTFDVRLPIGLLFLAIGGLLVGYGVSGDPAAMNAYSSGLNIDLIWGAVLAMFGALMVAMALTARRRAKPPED